MATWTMMTGDGLSILGDFEAPDDDLGAVVQIPAEMLASVARFGIGAETTMGELLALSIGTRPVISLVRAEEA